MDKTKNRELLPDILRGFAIVLVVLGHCIQEGSGNQFKINTMYFNDKFYQFIYSFHMPLFMMISGYFAWDSMEKTQGSREQWSLLRRRSVSLLIPILGWTCYDYIHILWMNGIEYPFFQSFIFLAKNFVLSFLENAWFLWAVFWCFLIVFLMHFYFKDSKLLYIVGFLLLFVIPDGLGLGAYKYMMPYFISAYYYRGWQKRPDEEKKIRLSEKCGKMSEWGWILFIGICFVFLFLFYDENSFIYLSGYKLIGKDVMRQLGIDFYRMLIGFVGAGFFILVWKKVAKITQGYSFPILTALGRNSLGIYMISGYIILQVGTAFGAYFRPNYLLNIVQAVVVLALSYGITIVLKRIPVLKWLTGR